MEGKIVGPLDLVFYWVRDLDRAMAFYRDVLGLEAGRASAGQWAEFHAGATTFALHAAAPGQPVQPGGATAVFRVDDLDAAKGALLARGVEFGFEGDVAGYARFATFRDPDGNDVQLIEYAGPGTEEPR